MESGNGPRRDGLFNKGARTIAREFASKKVSGKNLPAARLKVLESAKTLLHQKILPDTKKANSRAA
jgi:hypothetical protein